MKIPLLVITIIFISFNVMAKNNIDQWNDTNKTYKDLIEQGFEVKGYSSNTIEIEKGLKVLLFITVLQKKNEVYECQEYQTLDNNMKTLDMSLICRELSQPYERGIGT